MNPSEWLGDRGRRMTLNSGIDNLMRDLGSAFASSNGTRPIMMGGGNPAHIPGAEEIFHAQLLSLAANKATVAKLLGDYSHPAGDPGFRELVANFFNRSAGWNISAAHVAVTGGGQAAFLQLFAMLGGMRDHRFRPVLFPLVPEYIGYADQGLDPGMFVARRPVIEERGGRRFKYHIDFEALKGVGDISAICLSRPTNPSANVVNDEEMRRLSDLASERGVPLLIDNAYGLPFPGAVHVPASLEWQPHWILGFSLSKLGLPGLRSGLLIAHPELISRFATMNSVVQLSPGNLGPAMVGPLLADGRIEAVVREVIRPHYRARRDLALSLMEEMLPPGVDWALHEPEGAFFLWLRIRGFPGGSGALYEILKQRGLLVVPGHHFFTGLSEPWDHSNECLRLSYCIGEDQLRTGIGILGAVLREFC